MASVRYVMAVRGMDRTQEAAAAENECSRICSLMREMVFDHHNATQALEALQQEAVPWTIEQKKRIGASVQLALTGLASSDSANRTVSKEQECLKVYR